MQFCLLQSLFELSNTYFEGQVSERKGSPETAGTCTCAKNSPSIITATLTEKQQYQCKHLTILLVFACWCQSACNRGLCVLGGLNCSLYSYLNDRNYLAQLLTVLFIAVLPVCKQTATVGWFPNTFDLKQLKVPQPL